MLNDEEEKLYTLRYIISGLPPYVANHTVLCTEPLTLSYGGMEHLELFRKQNRRINKVLCSRTLSNPKITSAKVDQIDDEVLESIDSIPPGIDSFDAESNLIEYLLHRDTLINDSQKIDSLLYEFASFSPSPIPVKDCSDSLIEEIDIFLDGDGSIPPSIESNDFDSEDDDNSTSLPEFDSFHVDYPDSGDSTINVVEDIPDCPDCDDSRARGFVLRSLGLHILSFIWEIRYPNLIDQRIGYSLKDKIKAKPDKTEHGIGKSAKNRGQMCKRIENGA
ncbi:hypothetical protein Tco_0627167 [Tanacetum coccineum]|uniref:Uncharacterized protein n=1 Tax=Tanacetum coccineum TaxID=301880 RepID=A0ABQ4WLM6_9ASTR